MIKKCLLSSDKDEIEKFKKCFGDNGIVISEFESLLVPVWNFIDGVFKKVNECIIGETICFSDAFINEFVDKALKYGITIKNYHLYNKNDQIKIIDIRKPIVFISSLLPNMNKFEIANNLCQNLIRDNFSVLLVSSNPLDENLGLKVFPFHLINSQCAVKSLNQWFYQNAVETNADFIVVCVPGGIIQSSKYNRYCDYGLLDYLLVKAIKPNFILCSVFHNINAVENIPNAFAPYKINAFIRINKILDQNLYDFNFNNRSMIIQKQNIHITDSIEYDINDSNYIVDITKILNTLKKENK